MSQDKNSEKFQDEKIIEKNEDGLSSESNNQEEMLDDDEELIQDILKLNQNKKIEELENKIIELKENYLRAQAEGINIQKRSTEELKKVRDYSITSFAKDIVVVKDYLEMALKDNSGNFDAVKTGVDLTLKQLVQIFERNYIKEINPQLKDKLDPHLHQAISTVEVIEQDSNTIVEVMQKGYKLNERVLRPAMVVVAK